MPPQTMAVADDDTDYGKTPETLKATLRASIATDPPYRKLMLARSAVMPEPSTSAAGGIVLWKALGGLAAVAGIGAFFATLVSMCMMTPRSPKEWAVGLTSTAISSLCGGAYAILKLGLHQDLPADPVSQYLALVSGIGIVFTCGLPGWAIVRAIFTWLDKHKDNDIGEMAAAARTDAKAVL